MTTIFFDPRPEKLLGAISLKILFLSRSFWKIKATFQSTHVQGRWAAWIGQSIRTPSTDRLVRPYQSCLYDLDRLDRNVFAKLV